MLKNISNPINSRRVASILIEDGKLQGFDFPERKISVYLSDNKIENVINAIDILKSSGVIDSEFTLSQTAFNSLVDLGFLASESDYNHLILAKQQASVSREIEKETRSDEFWVQVNNLKGNVIKSWSGGLATTRLDLDSFTRRFTRPMNVFKDNMEKNGTNISDLQAYAVIFTSEYLGLSAGTDEDTYHLLFGRFDDIKNEIQEEYGITFTWPQISGSNFIEVGRKYSIAAELLDFTRRLQSVSGLDTYSDEVIQEIFRQLLDGELIQDLLDKKLVYRWASDLEKIDDPLNWIIPELNHGVDPVQRSSLIHAVIAHTLLTKIEKDDIPLLDFIRELYGTPEINRIDHLVVKLEHALTRKSVTIQFGTALINFYTNLKDNPSKSATFIDTSLRLLNKYESFVPLIQTLQSSVKSGLRISKGLTKKYIGQLSDQELDDSVFEAILRSLRDTVFQFNLLAEFEVLFDNKEHELLFNALNFRIIQLDEDKLREFFNTLMDNIFWYIKEYVKNLEPITIEPKTQQGGMIELTRSFFGTVDYSASKNPNVKILLEKINVSSLPSDLLDKIVKITSYSIYQIASKEGDGGLSLHNTLVDHFVNKFQKVASYRLIDGSTLLEKFPNEFENYLIKEMTQLHVIFGLGTKLKTDVFNAWTPLRSGKSKGTEYLNLFVVPNLLFWHRIPKNLVDTLIKTNSIRRDQIRDLVGLCNRLDLIEGYCLLIMSIITSINDFREAKNYLAQVFQTENSDLSLANAFKLSPRLIKPEIIKETSYLWFALMEK